LPASEGVSIIAALGEPLVRFAAEQRGRLGDMRTFRRGFGGDTSNFIVAAARMGAVCGYIARLGADEFGRAFHGLWEHEGVDNSRVIVEPDGTTGAYFISLRDDDGHELTYYRSHLAGSRLRPEDLDAAYLSRVRNLHTSGITQASSESTRVTAETAVAIVRGSGGLISFDLKFRPRLWSAFAARPVAEQTARCAHGVPQQRGRRAAAPRGICKRGGGPVARAGGEGCCAQAGCGRLSRRDRRRRAGRASGATWTCCTRPGPATRSPVRL
jgi:2-dehydro-3-deoxygluconokinase